MREVFFIPSDKPYQVLKEEVGTLSYVGDNGLFYLMFGNSIYSIDFSGEEYVEVVSGMSRESLVVSPDASAAAWQADGGLYDSGTIRVFYMDNGESFDIQAARASTCGPWLYRRRFYLRKGQGERH